MRAARKKPSNQVTGARGQSARALRFSFCHVPVGLATESILCYTGDHHAAEEFSRAQERQQSYTLRTPYKRPDELPLAVVTYADGDYKPIGRGRFDATPGAIERIFRYASDIRDRHTNYVATHSRRDFENTGGPNLYINIRDPKPFGCTMQLDDGHVVEDFFICCTYYGFNFGGFYRKPGETGRHDFHLGERLMPYTVLGTDRITW